jgi:hypothetical protein
LVGGDDKLVVGFAGDGEEIGHGVAGLCWRAIQALRPVLGKAKTRKISGIFTSSLQLVVE